MSMQGDWTSPRGENRRDLARQDSSEELPGRPGGDGRIGGNEIRESSGARRLTPAERVQAMSVPMQTGVVSNQKDAKGLSQKQVRQCVCHVRCVLYIYAVAVVSTVRRPTAYELIQQVCNCQKVCIM